MANFRPHSPQRASLAPSLTDENNQLTSERYSEWALTSIPAR
ncbi:MAG: hypothetical protein J07HX5_01201, partial [halophilic archaeon J07HX5]